MLDYIEKIIETNYKNELQLKSDKLDFNFYLFEDNNDEIDKFSHDNAINDHLFERIRRFNSSSEFLIESINRTIMLNEQIKSNKDNRLEILLRKELRNICINLEIYINKIITFCKYYLFFDIDKTDDGKIFMDTLKQFFILNPIFKKFHDLCSEAYQNSDLVYINDIRNKEIHNESPLDIHNYRFDDNCNVEDLGYKISDESIFEKIYNVVYIVIKIRKLLQELLEKVTPENIADFVQKNKLNNIIQPKLRYKQNI